MSRSPLPGTTPPVANFLTTPPLFKVAPPAPPVDDTLIVLVLVFIAELRELIFASKAEMVFVKAVKALVLLMIASAAFAVASAFSLSLLPVTDDPIF